VVIGLFVNGLLEDGNGFSVIDLLLHEMLRQAQNDKRDISFFNLLSSASFL
jgi:hypothetical protein